MTSEPGSFARRTFQVRVPKIILDTIEANDFPPDIVRALQALRDEILHGVIAPLREDAPDRAFWDDATRPFVGNSWLDVPWYWAESYLYRRMLEATRYFQPGDWFHRDPYQNQKDAELKPDAGPYTLDEVLRALPAGRAPRFDTLLHASLWGNRTDLSYNMTRGAPGSLAVEQERANIIVDDTTRVWAHLQTIRRGRVDFLCDNTGTELLFDLALADFLLREEFAARVTFHLKPQPYFVSDAMSKDADAAIAALARGELGQRLEQARAQRRLLFAEHWFAVTPLFYFEMPEDLGAEIAEADLVICKGDANYRRLLGDAHWDPTTPFAEAVAYFPATLVALRTLKSELIVGLPRGKAEQLRAEDADWRVDGKRGIVQFKG